MSMGLFANDFATVFSNILAETGVTCYQIHEYTGIDQAYLSRLKSGQKSNPSPEIVLKISLGLAHSSSKITLFDIDSLFRSVGRSLFNPKSKFT